MVALAYPLYEQLHQIRARWKSIIAICFCRERCGDGNRYNNRFVDGRITANCRVYHAKIGYHAYRYGRGRQYWRHSGYQRRMRYFCRYPWAVFGHTLLNAMRIRTKAARGLAMAPRRTPRVPHAVQNWTTEEGAFSSLALVICGIITSLVAPFLFPIILAVVG